ncbi:MAG: NAD(P)H-binding protein [Micrococcales bacterium]|nr:NAD(P)H-binding protein [Micrococcales bacterium]
MIVLTGATGALNGATAQHLLDRLPAEELVVVARDVTRAAHFADRGVRVRPGDYAHPESLPDAFAGADQLLLVSSNDQGVDPVELHRAAIDAAVTAGVGRILYTSHQGAAAESPFAPARTHAATEELLAAAGIPWTALRNGFYAHSLQFLLGPWQQTGVIAVPGEGPVSWTAREDAAQGAAAVLTAPTPYEGPVTLTATEAPTFERIAAIASELVDRRIDLRVVDPEEWIAAAIQAGQPEGRVRFMLGVYQAAERGLFAGTDPTLRMLLGREPRTVRSQLEELLARS